MTHNGEPGARSDMESLLGEAEELAQIGSWELDLKTGRAVWSDGMYRIHGLEPGSVEPRVDTMLERTHPDDRERMRELLETVTAHPETVPADGVTAEYRALRPDGSLRDVRFHGHVDPDADGRPERWLGVAHDVTEQRLTERELQARYAVTQALHEWESFDEGVISLLRRFGTALEFPLGALWIPDEDGRLATRAYWSAPDVDSSEFERATRAISFRPGQGVIGSVWSSGEPYFAEDVTPTLQAARREEARALGLRSALAMAAVGDDGPLAVLSFYAFDRREPSERLMFTLRGIGEELGHFLARRRAELGSGRLSERELEVLRLAAEGFTGPQIAERLFVSPATIKTHFEHIYEKLGVGDRAAAVAHAFRTGLIR